MSRGGTSDVGNASGGGDPILAWDFERTDPGVVHPAMGAAAGGHDGEVGQRECVPTGFVAIGNIWSSLMSVALSKSLSEQLPKLPAGSSASAPLERAVQPELNDERSVAGGGRGAVRSNPNTGGRGVTGRPAAMTTLQS